MKSSRRGRDRQFASLHRVVNGIVKLEVLLYAEGEKIPRNDFWGHRLSVARSFDARQ
jgi:hypothetical protein